MSDIVIVNFSHPLTPAQLARVEELAGLGIERVIDVATHFDTGNPFADQARALVKASGLSREDWQVMPLLVNLPSLSPIAVAVLAILHGLAGHFPAALRLRPVPGAVPTVFEVAEILNLNELRNEVRSGTL